MEIMSSSCANYKRRQTRGSFPYFRPVLEVVWKLKKVVVTSISKAVRFAMVGFFSVNLNQCVNGVPPNILSLGLSYHIE